MERHAQAVNKTLALTSPGLALLPWRTGFFSCAEVASIKYSVTQKNPFLPAGGPAGRKECLPFRLVFFADDDGRAVHIEVIELIEGDVLHLGTLLGDDGDAVRRDLMAGERLKFLRLQRAGRHADGLFIVLRRLDAFARAVLGDGDGELVVGVGFLERLNELLHERADRRGSRDLERRLRARIRRVVLDLDLAFAGAFGKVDIIFADDLLPRFALDVIDEVLGEIAQLIVILIADVEGTGELVAAVEDVGRRSLNAFHLERLHRIRIDEVGPEGNVADLPVCLGDGSDDARRVVVFLHAACKRLALAERVVDGLAVLVFNEFVERAARTGSGLAGDRSGDIRRRIVSVCLVAAAACQRRDTDRPDDCCKSDRKQFLLHFFLLLFS